MPDANIEVLSGTLELLILEAVSWAPPHAYAIARWIERAADDVLRAHAVFAVLEAAPEPAR
jgi:DNA-binding PadR family transcriptional regulator